MTIPATVLPELPLAEYQFNFQVLQELCLPAFSGSLWHGVFGNALRESVCFNLDWNCQSCAFLHHCDYSLLFSAPLPPETKLMRHYQTIPVPHIIKTETLAAERILPGKILPVRMILIGRANQKLPLIMQVLKKAGLNGLGKNRCQLQLQEVWQLNPNGLPALMYPALKQELLPPLGSFPLVAMPPRVLLRFMSPYKQSGKSSSCNSLDLPAFLMAIVRRVSLLQYFYTDKQLHADFKQLKTLSHALIVLDSQLSGQAQQRYSATHRKMLDVSGVLGSLELNLQGMEALWPYLYLGQWLNVGKNASMGFGRYQLLLV
jgi:CRISPR-associated endoribonuclease Cas6